MYVDRSFFIIQKPLSTPPRPTPVAPVPAPMHNALATLEIRALIYSVFLTRRTSNRQCSRRALAKDSTIDNENNNIDNVFIPESPNPLAISDKFQKGRVTNMADERALINGYPVIGVTNIYPRVRIILG